MKRIILITLVLISGCTHYSQEEEEDYISPEDFFLSDNTMDHCNEVVDAYVTRFLNSAHEGEENHYKGFWYCGHCGKGNVGLSDRCSKCGQPR